MKMAQHIPQLKHRVTCLASKRVLDPWHLHYYRSQQAWGSSVKSEDHVASPLACDPHVCCCRGQTPNHMTWFESQITARNNKPFPLAPAMNHCTPSSHSIIWKRVHCQLKYSSRPRRLEQMQSWQTRWTSSDSVHPSDESQTHGFHHERISSCDSDSSLATAMLSGKMVTVKQQPSSRPTAHWVVLGMNWSWAQTLVC